MKAVVTLTPSESKRLIAKAVVKMPEIQKAWKEAYLLLADGTTNAFIVQELLQNKDISPEKNAIGINTNGVFCVTKPMDRNIATNVFYKGKEKRGRTFAEALADYHEETVIVKGANAVDMDGFVGIVATGFDGGTIPKIIGPVTSKGITMITPVGLEKLIPSVPAAVKALGGASTIDISMGADGGMYCLCNSVIVTEIEAVKILFDAEATLVCSGGVGGSEGAVTLVIEGTEDKIPALMKFLENEVKGEPQIKGNKGNCEFCKYKKCHYCGKKEEELPNWLRSQDI